MTGSYQYKYISTIVQDMWEIEMKKIIENKIFRHTMHTQMYAYIYWVYENERWKYNQHIHKFDCGEEWEREMKNDWGYKINMDKYTHTYIEDVRLRDGYIINTNTYTNLTADEKDERDIPQ